MTVCVHGVDEDEGEEEEEDEGKDDDDDGVVMSRSPEEKEG